MPNWVTNNVSIFHEDQSVIDEMFDMLTRTPENGEENDDDRRVTFTKLVPMPPVLEGAIDSRHRKVLTIIYTDDEGRHRERPATEKEVAEMEKVGHTNWYDWREAHWGVKWDASHSTATKGDRSISLRFDTPWGPPEPIIDAIRERWPEAEVGGGWLEEGHQSCGPF
ncbi:MAG: hypothetical protein OXK74_02205 [Gemmatimonadota bacterium]|nr:hypothetical protein [Gemmatimonadota bacterium]